MAMATRAIRCQLPSLVTRCESSEPIKQIQIQQRPRGGDLAENGKIVLQPRLCTLRSYGSEMIVAKKDGGGGGDEGSEVELASPFFETLTDYIESSKKSQDFETISGRLAMVKKTNPKWPGAKAIDDLVNILINFLFCKFGDLKNILKA